MPRQMHSPTVVILVDHGFVSGGQSKVALESTLGLAQAGARPIFFCACGPVDPRLAQAGIETVCLGQHDILDNPSRAAAAVQGTWNAKAASALAELLARLPREDTIVHVHGWAKALSPSIAKPIRASNLPAVYTMHEYFLACPNGGFYNFQKHEVCGLKAMSAACWATNCDSRNYPFKLWRSARLAVARGAGLAECFGDFLLISDLQAALLAPYLPVGAKTHRVCDPVEAEALGPKHNPATGETLFVGRLSAEKGAMLFAEAARIARITPAFIGDGPIAPRLREEYPEARLLGWLEPAAVREAMRAARALVFPSLWYEGLGLTALEAKAMGTPVIVSDVCAAREQIADGEEGLWFKSGDADSLAGALERLKDDALVARLSRAAYESYWREPPTLARHVEQTLAVYREMLARRRG
ncbi:MAG: glycosyltransferase family 4 protein [Methylocystis sp.]